MRDLCCVGNYSNKNSQGPADNIRSIREELLGVDNKIMGFPW